MNLIRFWINIIFFYRASLGNGAVQAKNAWTSVPYIECVWAYLQAAVTIHLGWQYLHLLEEQHSAGQGEHLRGQGALTGTEESNHPLPVFRDFCDTEDYLDKSRCSRFTNSLSSNKSSVAAIFYHYFCLWGHILQTILNVTFYHPCLRNIFYVSLNLTFSLCKVLTYIFTWYFFCKPEPYIFFL